MNAQDIQTTELKKSPKQKTIEVGGRYIYSTIYSGNTALPKSLAENKANIGITALFDYAWQVSGFNGKHAAAYITIPIGYTMMFADNKSQKSSTVLSYGWTVRHELTKGKKMIPFFGYALMLNSLKYGGMSGSWFGHNTRFELGVNYYHKPHVIPFAKVQWLYTSYPQLGDTKRLHVQAIELNTGIRF